MVWVVSMGRGLCASIMRTFFLPCGLLDDLRFP